METISGMNDEFAIVSAQTEIIDKNPRAKRKRMLDAARPFIKADVAKFGSKQTIIEDGYTLVIAHSPYARCTDSILDRDLRPAPEPTFANAWVTFDGSDEPSLATHLYLDDPYTPNRVMDYHWYFDIWDPVEDQECNDDDTVTFEEEKNNMISVIRNWARATIMSKESGRDRWDIYMELFCPYRFSHPVTPLQIAAHADCTE